MNASRYWGISKHQFPSSLLRPKGKDSYQKSYMQRQYCVFGGVTETGFWTGTKIPTVCTLKPKLREGQGSRSLDHFILYIIVRLILSVGTLVERSGVIGALESIVSEPKGIRSTPAMRVNKQHHGVTAQQSKVWTARAQGASQRRLYLWEI